MPMRRLLQMGSGSGSGTSSGVGATMSAGSTDVGMSGFAQLPVVCGASGQYVTLSFPNMLPPGGKLAVRLCTVLASQMGAYGDATLNVETSMMP